MTKAHGNQKDFVGIAKEMLQHDLNEDDTISAALIETKANQLEIEFINNQLVSKVQYLKAIRKRSLKERTNYIKDDLDKSIYKKQNRRLSSQTEELASVKNTQYTRFFNFFTKSWAEKPIGRRGNSILYSIRCKPDKWIKKMDSLYSRFSSDELHLLSLSSTNFTLEDLIWTYIDVNPSTTIYSVSEFRTARTYHNWAAVAICVVLSKQITGKETIYNKLMEYQTKFDWPKGSARLVNTLAKHCWTTYRFYQELGDFVILSPDLFEKHLLIHYPEDEIKALIQTIKSTLPKEVIEFKKFL